jgi:hypothetical protein
MGEIFLRLLRFSCVSVIPFVLHIHISYIYHWRYNLSNWQSLRKIRLVAVEENFISSEWKLYSHNLRPKQTPASHMNMLELENEVNSWEQVRTGFSETPTHICSTKCQSQKTGLFSAWRLQTSHGIVWAEVGHVCELRSTSFQAAFCDECCNMQQTGGKSCVRLSVCWQCSQRINHWFIRS